MSEKSADGKRVRRGVASRSKAESSTARLQQALQAAAASIELRRADHLRLLEAIVGTAVRVIDATGGSLMLLDPTGAELVFQVAVGPGSEEIRQFRVPVGQGIAGFVASTGQAMAIADTTQDTRFARQIAEGSGYVPHNLLCVPLILRGDVIGVIELLDKGGGTASFTPEDTAVLASFGEQAAQTIDLSLQAQSLELLLAGAMGGSVNESIAEDVRAAAAGAASTEAHNRTLALAVQVATISAAGEREARLCADVLAAMVRYLRESPSLEASIMLGMGFGRR